MLKITARKINLFRLIAALISISIMMSVLITYITPQPASAQTATSEIRGVWVATVFGLDFPSGYTSSEKEIKKRIDDIMDNCKKARLNTVFFQVRPASDAFYKSEIFPWSRYLTGTQGKAPENGCDPLKYAIESAHKRDLALHAWINPYRVTVSAGDENGFSPDNPALLHPEYVITHTDGKMYYNPGLPEVRKLVADGIDEIIKNYAVDGIHLDDYFYPDGNFSDGDAYAAYGNGKDLDEWRRDNVTALIKELTTIIHKENEKLIFSVSPAGIWANQKNHPDGSATSGSETYFNCYADTKLWVKEDLIDWIMPQIYWHRGFEIADFTILANWWKNVTKNTSVKLCPGLAAYRASDTTDQTSPWYGENGINELTAQIEYLRMCDIDGYAFYRYGSLTSNDNLMKMSENINKSDEPSEVFTDINKFPWAKNAILRLYEDGIVKGYEDKSFGSEKTVTRADFTLMLIRATGKSADFSENFDDVKKGDYFYKEVGIAKKLNLVNGLGENQFMPRLNITRQDIAVIIYRFLLSEKLIKKGEWNDSLFKDSEEIKDYAREAVSALSREGIINGYEDDSFKPSATATRAETAVMIFRMKDLL